ncbi:MAG TPA: ATP-binding protein [Acidobacteriota bacterium]|jgi:serine/threonine-protein kinase RsbW|nr:ATP-binding protein [Acidobacteriota bacterium]
MSPRANVVEVTVESSLDHVELIQTLADNITKMMGFDEDTSHWIGMSIRESVVNAIQHGNKMDKNKKVGVKFEIYQDRLVVNVEDQGEGFDPSRIPDPLTGENLMRPSGRGIFFMKSFMDQVEFLPGTTGGTRLRMTKKVRF